MNLFIENIASHHSVQNHNLIYGFMLYILLCQHQYILYNLLLLVITAISTTISAAMVSVTSPLATSVTLVAVLVASLVVDGVVAFV